jgi:hypothetical protein
MNYEYKKQDPETLAKTIYGEARGEFYRFGPASLIAVALHKIMEN